MPCTSSQEYREHGDHMDPTLTQLVGDQPMRARQSSLQLDDAFSKIIEDSAVTAALAPTIGGGEADVSGQASMGKRERRRSLPGLELAERRWHGDRLQEQIASQVGEEEAGGLASASLFADSDRAEVGLDRGIRHVRSRVKAMEQLQKDLFESGEMPEACFGMDDLDKRQFSDCVPPSL